MRSTTLLLLCAMPLAPSAPIGAATSAQASAGPAIVQEAYLKASNTDPDDRFGYATAISGNTLVVSAIHEASAAEGVNGDETDDSVPQAGAVYVFVRENGAWTQQAYLKATTNYSGKRFGEAVAISGDTIVVSAHDATGGVAHVFVRDNGVWAQQAELKGSNTESGDFFTSAVAISGDTIAIGASQEDSAATGVGGNEHADTELLSGAVYVFVRSGTVWTQQAYVKASNTDSLDGFGASVALDGDTLAVGAAGEDSAATGVGGNQSDNSMSLAGAVYVFRRTGSTWAQEAYLKASNTNAFDEFHRVALSGDTLVVGADMESSQAAGIGGDQSDNGAANAGAVYVFQRSGTTWSQEAYVKASNPGINDFFGKVAVAGERFAASAFLEDSAAVGVDGDQASDAVGASGAGYLFERGPAGWGQQHYVKASNTGAGDQFGSSLAMTTEYLVVGAAREDSAATGVGGDQADDSAVAAGAVYVFDLCPPVSASEVVRLGSPPNPNALLPGQTSGPYVGATWDPVVDHASFQPGAVLDFLAIGLSATNIPTGIGTILCGLTPPLVVSGPPGAPFALPIPADCSPVGVALFVQGGSVDAGLAIALTNALDITLGNL